MASNVVQAFVKEFRATFRKVVESLVVPNGDSTDVLKVSIDGFTAGRLHKVYENAGIDRKVIGMVAMMTVLATQDHDPATVPLETRLDYAARVKTFLEACEVLQHVTASVSTMFGEDGP